MLTAGFVVHAVADWFGINAVETFSVRFRDRVWPGDTVTVIGEIVEIDRRAADVSVEAEFAATNQADDPLLTGAVTATLADPEEVSE